MSYFNRLRRTVFAVPAFLLALAPLQLSADVIPVTYQFTGICSPGDCATVGIGLLTLNNYNLGDTITKTNFAGFSYSSNLVNFAISNATDLASISGAIYGPLPSSDN